MAPFAIVIFMFNKKKELICFWHPFQKDIPPPSKSQKSAYVEHYRDQPTTTKSSKSSRAYSPAEVVTHPSPAKQRDSSKKRQFKEEVAEESHSRGKRWVYHISHNTAVIIINLGYVCHVPVYIWINISEQSHFTLPEQIHITSIYLHSGKLKNSPVNICLSTCLHL